MLYLYGESSAPVLCFSLVLVMGDHHERARTFGSESKEWVVKEIGSVLFMMELEHFIAVLGLAYEFPYVPNDGTRLEKNLLHLTLVNNAFCFGTSMMSKNGEFNRRFIVIVKAYHYRI